MRAARRAIVRSPGARVVAVVALALAAFPFAVADPFYQQIVVMTLMYGALGAAWNLVGGFLGRVSFGHAVFVGLGAYTTLLLLHHLRLTPWLGIPSGALVAAAAAFVVG